MKTDIIQYQEILNGYETIDLLEMDSVKLMNRVDTKFLINNSQLIELLNEAKGQYKVVNINNQLILPYSTIYYDTEGAKLYKMHQNGKLNRVKIRTRSYVSTGISFLEIKEKSNKGRTTKKRIKIDTESFNKMEFGEKELNFIRSNPNTANEKLVPQLRNFFNRITLVDNNKTERVTIDFNLAFENLQHEFQSSVNDLVIIEMKQDGAANSFFKSLISEKRIQPSSMSKYCLGMVLLNEDIKYNRFKKKIRHISKLINHHDTDRLTRI